MAAARPARRIFTAPFPPASICDETKKRATPRRRETSALPCEPHP